MSLLLQKISAIMLGGTTRKASLLCILLLYVVVFLVCPNKNTCVVVDAADIKCIEKERHALLMIKKDLVDEYGHLSSWSDEEDCCNNWRGIRCNNQTHHVTMLDLRVSTTLFWWDSDYKPLKGKISHSLLELQHLTYLDLSMNDFEQSHIPAFIGSLTKLTYLNLSYALFDGTIPDQLGNLSSLQFLDLSYQLISSENLSWLSHLSSLRYLDMSDVNLEKAVDWIQAINMLPSIVDLRLWYCYLSSAIPPHLSLLNSSSSSSLSVLDLSDNSLTSEIYQWLFNFVGHSLVDLYLSSNQLKGPIPDSFENMTSLTLLDLSRNQFQGVIPKSLGNLLHLQTLDISSNDLDGNLPEIVRNLYGQAMNNTLEILDLSVNRISGYVPDITIFSSLKELRLSNNNLNGSLPKRFEHLSKLEVLDMGYNHITGSLPDLSVFSSLRFLDMSYNQIKGSLPDLSVFSSLKNFSLSNNQINGNLPENVGQLSKLEYLGVSSNKLQGTISEAHFSTLTELKFLDLSNNHLILDLSSEWKPPFQLNIIRLQSCKLGPHFPIWLQTQNIVYDLDISNSGISDVIPSWFWDLCYNMRLLNLSYNHINGILPNLSSKSFNFGRIDFSSNHLEGPIPTFVSSIISLDLSINMFRGSISVLCAMIGRGLRFLDLSDNLLSGELPDCWWREENYPLKLVILNLANNFFSGKIPGSMGSLQGIQSLHLNNNSLNGELPSSLQNCTSLRVIDVGENRLSGNVPAWIGEKLSNLIILRLHSNEFYGSIPVQLCYLTELRILDISLNNITGTIPGCINNFTAMAQKGHLDKTIEYEYDSYVEPQVSKNLSTENYVDNAMVLCKGLLSKYTTILGLVKSIDLSRNNLTGEIPSEITHLSELILLNLSRNSLTGLIPYNIGRLTLLDSLDLSRNHLFGEIPVSMSDLSSLGKLDLSNNNLAGKIPSGTPLQSREASAFSGNRALCGPPLTQMCPGDDIFPTPPTGSSEDADIQEEEDEFVFDRWFYASIALGFIVGFWGVCGTLVLHRSWRHAYFQWFDNFKDWVYVRIAVHKARMMRKFQS